MDPDAFVRLNRRFFNHYLWEERRVFSRAEAFLDLIRSAAFEEGKRMVKGILVNVPRGGIVASERFLSDRWMWSRTKVRAFLDMLQSDSMIVLQKDQENTIVILCKYDTYNPKDSPEKPHKDHEKTRERPGEDQSKEGIRSKEPEGAKAPIGVLDEAKAKERAEKVALMQRVGEIMHRRAASRWEKKETSKLGELWPIPEEDLAAVEAYYAANWPPKSQVNILRHDLQTLLNHWAGEVDRANQFQSRKARPAQKVDSIAIEVMLAFLEAHPEYKAVQPMPGSRAEMAEVSPGMRDDWDKWIRTR